MKVNNIFIFIFFLSAFSQTSSGSGVHSGSGSNSCKKLRLRLTPSVYNFDTGTTGLLNLIVEQQQDHHDEENKNSSRSCSFFVGFGYGDASSPHQRRLRHQSHFLPVQIWKDAQRSQILKDLPEATSPQEVLTGTFTSKEKTQISFNYLVDVSITDLPYFGMYQDQFWVRLYEGSVNGKNSLVDSNLLILHYHQPKIAEISLVDQGAPFDKNDQSQIFDFGELQQGQTKSCDIVAVYNAGLRIWMTSANRGLLKPIEKKKKSAIPYQTRINGALLSWPASGSIKIDSRRGRSPVGGYRYNLDATIGPLGLAPAGEYKDQITIRIESTE